MPSAEEPQPSQVHAATRGRVSVITLDRPKAINALTLDMIRDLDRLIAAADADPAIDVIVLRGAGERGFCAGGDMVSVRTGALAGDPTTHEFFLEEYALNARIARCATPIVALMDGLVLGGGVGLSGHASHRLVTERSKVGMPEVGIGFVPDVGGTWLLSRAPGQLGTFVALTGDHVGPLDAIELGLADAMVPSGQLDAVVDRIVAGEHPDAVVASGTRDTSGSALAAHRGWIDSCFAGDDVAGIVGRLGVIDDPAARHAADVMATRSPTSLVVTLAMVRRARFLASLEACLALEYSAVLPSIGTHDLSEGVRAALVDKDRRPVWQPPRLADVSAAEVAAFFRRFDEGETSIDDFC
ncbi:MAG: 3-hydroxyisobutyryl-CoA hydrolase [Ilumatobacteraceae bacterium]